MPDRQAGRLDAPGLGEEGEGDGRDRAREQIRGRVAPDVSRAAEDRLGHHPAARGHQRVEGQDGRPLLGRDRSFRYACRMGTERGEEQPPDGDQHDRHPEHLDQPDQEQRRHGQRLRGEQRRGAAAEPGAQPRRDEPPDDLRPRDDRGDQPRDAVRLGVSVEVEQVGLEGVEDVDPHPAGERRRQHDVANRRDPQPVPDRSSARSRISASGCPRRVGVNPMSRISANATPNMRASTPPAARTGRRGS